MIAEAPAETVVQFPEIEVRRILVRVRGTSPLIVHKWSRKAKQAMLDKQMKRATRGKELKDPQRDYEESMYIRPDGSYGFPAVGFKGAAVAAGRYCDMKMTFLRGAFHVDGELVKIDGEPRPREDMVRLAMNTADIRYRAEFPEWTAELPISYNARAITVEQIVNLFNLAGFSVGVGEWRPERDGQYGRFQVEGEDDARIGS